MRTNFKKALLLLPLVPFLVAATEYPVVYEKTYKDFEVTFEKKEMVDDYFYYYYSLNNTGSGFITHLSHYNIGDSEDPVAPFKNVVYGPGITNNICFKTYYTDIENPSELKFNAKAYNLAAEGIGVSGSKAVTFKSKGYDYYSYKVDISLTGEQDKETNYGVVLKIHYEDNDYYVKLDQREEYLINVEEELDLTKLTVSDVTAIQSDQHASENYKVENAFSIGVIVFLLLTLSFGIFAAIFFPAMARRRRRLRRLKQNQSQNK